MQITIFANFALVKAGGWSYKPCHTNVTFNRKVSVSHKLNFHPCHRNFLKAGCRSLVLRGLWWFGWETQSVSGMAAAQISSHGSCLPPAAACSPPIQNTGNEWQMNYTSSERLLETITKKYNTYKPYLHTARQASLGKHAKEKKTLQMHSESLTSFLVVVYRSSGCAVEDYSRI